MNFYNYTNAMVGVVPITIAVTTLEQSQEIGRYLQHNDFVFRDRLHRRGEAFERMLAKLRLFGAVHAKFHNSALRFDDRLTDEIDQYQVSTCRDYTLSNVIHATIPHNVLWIFRNSWLESVRELTQHHAIVESTLCQVFDTPRSTVWNEFWQGLASEPTRKGFAESATVTAVANGLITGPTFRPLQPKPQFKPLATGFLKNLAARKGSGPVDMEAFLKKHHRVQL